MKGGSLNPYLKTLSIVALLLLALVHGDLHFLGLGWMESNGPFTAAWIARSGLCKRK